MKNFNFIFFVFLFALLSCQGQNEGSSQADGPEKAVNLAESEGCGKEKSSSDSKSDEVSFAQSSKLDSEISEDEIFDEKKESDSGCTL